MFKEAVSFNVGIGEWNTVNVTNMSRMFEGATKFNKDISEWNTANVTDMNHMFEDAKAFRCGYGVQGLNGGDFVGEWNIQRVTNMNNMFLGATAFNLEMFGEDAGGYGGHVHRYMHRKGWGPAFPYPAFPTRTRYVMRANEEPIETSVSGGKQRKTRKNKGSKKRKNKGSKKRKNKGSKKSKKKNLANV
jgi:surface protein